MCGGGFQSHWRTWGIRSDGVTYHRPVLERRVFVDHMTVRVRDLDASRRFYEAALRPLGAVVIDIEGEVTFGPPGAEDFLLAAADAEHPASGPLHFAFLAADEPAVRAFYEAGLAAGGRDNGAPGPRTYHLGYYAAYLFDPDGNNVEAVFHGR
jgi:catechol 2,3-dioxygenase-like lactoylglutathione lyase family enzyme